MWPYLESVSVWPDSSQLVSYQRNRIWNFSGSKLDSFQEGKPDTKEQKERGMRPQSLYRSPAVHLNPALVFHLKVNF